MATLEDFLRPTARPRTGSRVPRQASMDDLDILVMPGFNDDEIAGAVYLLLALTGRCMHPDEIREVLVAKKMLVSEERLRAVLIRLEQEKRIEVDRSSGVTYHVCLA